MSMVQVKQFTLTAVEKIFYYLAVVVTSGMLFAFKVAIKRAIYEAINQAVADGLINVKES